MKQNSSGGVMESTLRPKNPVKRRQLLLASGVHKREINYRDDGKMACPFLMTCCIMANGNPIYNTDYGCCLIPSAVCCSDGIHCCPAGYRCGTTKCYRDHKPFFPETMGFHKILVTDLGQNPSGAPNDNFRKNICSEDDLRFRIFETFVVKFLACLPLLGFSNM